MNADAETFVEAVDENGGMADGEFDKLNSPRSRYTARGPPRLVTADH
jgi:hypothetical protein